MRLIDADALTKMLNCHEKDCNPDHFDGHETFIDKIDSYDSYGEWQFANGFNLGIVASIVDIQSTPTIDAVPVVRCKDCFYRDGNVCDYSSVYVRPHGYCQWGRREEDDNH